jgi:hypothetical protein
MSRRRESARSETQDRKSMDAYNNARVYDELEKDYEGSGYRAAR